MVSAREESLQEGPSLLHQGVAGRLKDDTPHIQIHHRLRRDVRIDDPTLLAIQGLRLLTKLFPLLRAGPTDTDEQTQKTADKEEQGAREE